MRLGESARHADRTHRQRGEALVGEAHRLQPPQPFGVLRQPVLADHRLFVDDLLDVPQEPRIVVRNRLDFLDREAFAECLGHLEQPVGRGVAQRRGDLLARGAFELDHAVEPVEPRLEPAQRLLHRFLEEEGDEQEERKRRQRDEEVGDAHQK